MNIETQIRLELERAEQARARGNEGQARVCARRAAGMAARSYFERHGQSSRTPSAYDLLNQLAQDATLPAELRQRAERLTLRVDQEFKLPADIDLIVEARRLCEGVLGA